jgi:hypothetical protein
MGVIWGRREKDDKGGGGVDGRDVRESINANFTPPPTTTSSYIDTYIHTIERRKRRGQGKQSKAYYKHGFLRRTRGTGS